MIIIRSKELVEKEVARTPNVPGDWLGPSVGYEMCVCVRINWEAMHSLSLHLNGVAVAH